MSSWYVRIALLRGQRRPSRDIDRQPFEMSPRWRVRHADHVIYRPSPHPWRAAISISVNPFRRDFDKLRPRIDSLCRRKRGNKLPLAADDVTMASSFKNGAQPAWQWTVTLHRYSDLSVARCRSLLGFHAVKSVLRLACISRHSTKAISIDEGCVVIAGTDQQTKYDKLV